ncbi:hypothetical protein [Bifidobacterium moraviense]|uniref:hypothetical protein n=1 Tax=Bifidobacterium moraviense TaxID=2675323 RepID=UPI00145DF62F|nr:hypothetical protein [Bifidobacterium sp. DSM 109958]
MSERTSPAADTAGQPSTNRDAWERALAAKRGFVRAARGHGGRAGASGSAGLARSSRESAAFGGVGDIASITGGEHATVRAGGHAGGGRGFMPFKATGHKGGISRQG